MSTSQAPNICEAVQEAGGPWWFCPVCGHRSRRRFVRRCGSENARVTRADRQTVEPAEVRLPPTIEQRVAAWAKRQKEGDRTEAEALELLDRCRSCPDFRGNHCARDRGCDRAVVFLIRLFCRRCPEWGVETSGGPGENQTPTANP